MNYKDILRVLMRMESWWDGCFVYLSGNPMNISLKQIFKKKVMMILLIIWCGIKIYLTVVGSTMILERFHQNCINSYSKLLLCMSEDAFVL